MNDGDRTAADELLPMVYDELRGLAGKVFARRGDQHTLQATALVHEVYLKLIGSRESRKAWSDRVHFFAVASTAMRRVLTDYARTANRVKRGGGAHRITLDESLVEGPAKEAIDLVALNDALEDLEEASPRIARVVELRYLCGLTVEEVAQELGVAERTVFKDWRSGRAHLRRFLGGVDD